MTRRRVRRDPAARHGYRAPAPKCRSGELTKASVDLWWIRKDKNQNLQACVDHVALVNAALRVCLHIDRRQTGMEICFRQSCALASDSKGQEAFNAPGSATHSSRTDPRWTVRHVPNRSPLRVQLRL